MVRVKFLQTPEELCNAAIGFSTISFQASNCNCVLVLNSYHLEIVTPSKKEAKNVKPFFSGRCQTYGVNIQEACDHQCHFTFIGVASPGVMGDQEAITQIRLGDLIKKVSWIVLCNRQLCLHTSEHLVPIFCAEQAIVAKNDNFNFFASQLCIQIETAFGLMVKKWAILSHPLSVTSAAFCFLVAVFVMYHNP
jgi:DDE superfamily endonuclease